MATHIAEETLDARTIVLRNVSGSLTEMEKDSLLRGFYQHGAHVHWISTTECLLAFATARQTDEAVGHEAATSLSLFKVSQLEERERASYYHKAAEMHADLKVNRGPSAGAANRIIGAALGIKLKKQESTRETETSKPSPIVDAWDD